MDVTALAALAGNTVVAAAVTDAFEGVRGRVARLFGRGKPDPSAQALEVQQRLEMTRAVASSAAGADGESVRAALRAQWRAWFAELLDADPGTAAELASLVAELRADQDAGGKVTNQVIGGVQHGPVIMGRDFSGITLTIGPPPDAER
jgi:CTP:molybdopterin cytidylyltransferase MocA